MNGTDSTNETATAGNGGGFDPEQAAALLEQTTQQARRGFQAHPPWLAVARGVGVLIVYGAIWLSVRGQHPYLHPTAAAAPGGIAFGLLTLAAVIAVRTRATAGVSGRTRLHRAEIVAAAVTWIVAYAIMGVLIGAGVSDSIVYGLYPAAVPLIAAGLVWAGLMARRRDWRSVSTALAVAIVGGVGLSAGPAGVWAVVGVGICLVLLASAAYTAWRQHHG
jgi:hypothetical protein